MQKNYCRKFKHQEFKVTLNKQQKQTPQHYTKNSESHKVIGITQHLKPSNLKVVLQLKNPTIKNSIP